MSITFNVSIRVICPHLSIVQPIQRNMDNNTIRIKFCLPLRVPTYNRESITKDTRYSCTNLNIIEDGERTVVNLKLPLS